MTGVAMRSMCRGRRAIQRIGTLAISLLLLFPCCEAEATAGPDDSACAAIADRSHRLDCFDGKAARSRLVSASSGHALPVRSTAEDVISVAQDKELKRKRSQSGFLFTDDPVDGKDEASVVMASTPSVSPSEPGSFLVLSCVSNISRIQIISGQPIARPRAAVTLMQGETTHGSTTEWRVLGGGRVVDGGRGIPAIERIRSLREDSRLYVGSNSAVLDGLLFDMTGVEQVIGRLREACHW